MDFLVMDQNIQLKSAYTVLPVHQYSVSGNWRYDEILTYGYFWLYGFFRTK